MFAANASMGGDTAQSGQGRGRAGPEITPQAAIRFFHAGACHPKKPMPNLMQAGVYSGAMAYLQAVDKVGSSRDSRAVVVAMHGTPINDLLFGR